jgi:hypothetical protein
MSMHRNLLTPVLCSLFVGATCAATFAAEYIPQVGWQKPAVIDPGPAGGPPSDATVLFDGNDMSKWNRADQWVVKDGYVISGGGDIQSKQAFGDCQLHVEWAAPEKVVGSGQGRGNSGVYMMSIYEIQVLDSFNNDTYYDGQAASVYKQHPPMVNASRKPGEWQTYDIIWQAPRFNGNKLAKPAYVTVLHNGVLMQNHFELQGGTFWDQKPHYTPHADRLPITLQFHGNPVRFRNIWVREIKEPVSKPGTPHHPG